MDIETASLARGESRVKFKAEWAGTTDSFLQMYPTCVNQFELVCSQLKQHLRILEDYGVAPVMHDGKVAGNAGAMLTTSDGDVMIVSKSGKKAKLNMDSRRDFAVIKSFDKTSWSCTYYCNDESVLPTSDTPLYYTAFTASQALGWKRRPFYILHAHAFASEEDAKKYGFRISMEETLFSTPADSDALFNLMKTYPFPEDKIYIRKGHGFLILGKDGDEAWNEFKNRMEPHIKKNGHGFYYDYCNYYIG